MPHYGWLPSEVESGLFKTVSSREGTRFGHEGLDDIDVLLKQRNMSALNSAFENSKA